jgi:hypothetical protein
MNNEDRLANAEDRTATLGALLFAFVFRHSFDIRHLVRGPSARCASLGMTRIHIFGSKFQAPTSSKEPSTISGPAYVAAFDVLMF